MQKKNQKAGKSDNKKSNPKKSRNTNYEKNISNGKKFKITSAKHLIWSKN